MWMPRTHKIPAGITVTLVGSCVKLSYCVRAHVVPGRLWSPASEAMERLFAPSLSTGLSLELERILLLSSLSCEDEFPPQPRFEVALFSSRPTVSAAARAPQSHQDSQDTVPILDSRTIKEILGRYL